MALVVVAGSSLLYVRLQDALDQSINQSLSAQLAEVTALASQADTGLQQGIAAAQGRDIFAQVIDSHGTVIDATPQLQGKSVLTTGQLRSVSLRPQTFHLSRTRFGGAAQLLAAPVNAQGSRLVIVVATPLSDRNQALSSLRTELLVGGPIALLVFALGGYLLAAAALQPVEHMREQTQRISARNLSGRVPLPQSNDEIHRLGTTLNELLSQLEQSLNRERRFVADASHELRTPLAMLKTELEIALRQPRSTQELTATVTSAAWEADHIARLADDLLILSRADTNGIPLQKTNTDLDTVLGHVASRFHSRAAQLGRKIIVINDNAGSADVDPTRLEQALGNLVDNALIHGDGEITLRATTRDNQVELHVRDQGQGFPPEFLPKAFDRFTRPDTARTGHGTGLGLSIVAAITHAHGGNTTARNLPTGTDVEVLLPR